MNHLFRHPKGRDGLSRTPVLLHKDGELEPVKLTPYRLGTLTASARIPELLLFTDSDCGYPKLRWIKKETQ